MSADNQQERQIGWIVGFVDGEGTFSVSINKNSGLSCGWQVFPEFVITQGAKSIEALETIQNYFNCGKLYVNRRHDNHKENLYRYCVRSFTDLEEKIVPFFEQNELQTAKRFDFEKFVKVLAIMRRKSHYTPEGMKEIANIIQTMNRKKLSRYLLSSETTRQTLI